MPRDFELLRHWRPEPATKREVRATEGLARGDFEIYRHKMELICWEAYQTFARMGISPMIEAGDTAVGIYTRQGDLAMGIMGTQLHLINASIGIKWMMRHFYEEPSVGIHEGDMFYTNDPLYGGIHNCDQILFMPVFWPGGSGVSPGETVGGSGVSPGQTVGGSGVSPGEKELVGWVAAASHETETGSTEPGGTSPSAKTRYDEGLLLSPIKIAERYQLKADQMEMMENRVRDPRQQTLDIKARVAAAHVLERRCHEIIGRMGVDFFIGSMRRMIDEGVAAARQKLASMHDGVYRTTVFLENAGNAKYGLMVCRVEVDKRGEECFVRFYGSPRVTEGNFNIFPHMMIAQVACYLFQYFFWELPATTGYYEPFHFEFQKGSFFMADPEDATSLGVATQAQVITGFHVAMEKMKFSSPYHDHVAGSWAGTASALAVGGLNKEGLPFAAWDQGQPNGAGTGGRWDSDGIDVAGFIWCAIGEFIDSEAIEHNFPLLPIFRSAYWRDAVGYGKYRGGRSMAAMYRIHGVPFAAVVPLGGFSARPIAPGLFGGYPSRPMAVAIVRRNNLDALIAQGRVPRDVYEAVERVEGDWTVVHSCSAMAFVNQGDLVLGFAASGPGYGDVLERSPDMVMADLRDETISHRTARDVYKVVYREDNLVVDQEATELARKAEREARIARGKPYGEWEAEWRRRRPPAHVLRYYGSWPQGSFTKLVDWEPTEEVVDEHVREGGAPRPRPSRY